VLVRDNLIERCVQNATDAGGLKFWGATADRSHCFRDVLVYRNLSRWNRGWAFVSEARDNWTFHGKGGMGYYIDFAGGIHFFRNLAADNGLAGFMASGSWPDQGVVLANNTIVNSPLGYTLGVRGELGSQTTQLFVTNTIFLHLQRWALSVGEPSILEGNVSLDFDLFHQVGYEPWPGQAPGILAGHVDDTGFRSLPTLAEVQTLGLEPSGATGDPRLAGFDPDPPEGFEQDLRLTSDSSLALDEGGPLPAALLALLTRFGLDPGAKGAALDRGAIEHDPAHPDEPFVLDVGPSSGVSDASPPWDADYPDPDPDPDPDGNGGKAGCGCHSAADPGASLALLLLLFAAIVVLRRRREA
jgi:MYXO-CTERM domain-containing protein